MSQPDDERRRRFVSDCHAGRIDITYVPLGWNLELIIDPNRELHHPPLTRDAVDLQSEPIKVSQCLHKN